MEQKKRLNPEITQEDLKNYGVINDDSAIKAFDKNNDALRLEDKVQAEKGEGALRDEFCHLITKIFGEDLYFMNYNNFDFETGSKAFNGSWIWNLGKQKRKAGWFKKAEYNNYIALSPTTVPDYRGGMTTTTTLPIYENGKFNPIKITAYTPEALKQAREFVKAYKSLSGQECTLIQECADEEEMKKHLPEEESIEQKVENKAKFEKYNLPAIKSKLAMLNFDLLGVTLNSGSTGLSIGLMIANIQKQNYEIALFNLGCAVITGFMARNVGKKLITRYEDSLKDL